GDSTEIVAFNKNDKHLTELAHHVHV
ncbi:MAG: hypothetical protein ACI8UX_001881, partial [Psychromonas sp.]